MTRSICVAFLFGLLALGVRPLPVSAQPAQAELPFPTEEQGN